MKLSHRKIIAVFWLLAISITTIIFMVIGITTPEQVPQVLNIFSVIFLGLVVGSMLGIFTIGIIIVSVGAIIVLIK